jgi:hypothetical protein
VKILPLRLDADVADKMDEAWRSKGIKNRHPLAAEIELATPARERWNVEIDVFYDACGRVYLELCDATPAEATRAMALLKTLG